MAPEATQLNYLKKISITVIACSDILSIAVLVLARLPFTNGYKLSDEFELFASHAMSSIGVVILFLSVLGMLAVIRENTFLTNVFVVLQYFVGRLFFAEISHIFSYSAKLILNREYALCLLMLLLVQVSASIAAFRMHSDPVGHIIPNSVLNYEKDPEVQQFLDSLQTELSCCGTGQENFKNWLMLHPNVSVPASCCSTYDLNNECSALHSDNCALKLDSWIDNYCYNLGCCGILQSIVQIIGIVVANRLAQAIRTVKTTRAMIAQQHGMGMEVHI